MQIIFLTHYLTNNKMKSKEMKTNCGSFSLKNKKPVKSSDSTPSYSFSKKTPSKSSMVVNRPAGF
jgi:hypothetical protein